uniref:Pre-mRNA-splicing regulator WTAP n=1 Tax=Pavo cristatus TaxID=9049 RepID=A0A8C9FH46_PAVCR
MIFFKKKKVTTCSIVTRLQKHVDIKKHLSCSRITFIDIQYLKQVQQPSVAQLRSTMVDPAINLFFLKMKGELEQTKDKLEQAQNELSAWKFTPDR